MKRLEAARGKGNQCEVSKCFYASKVKITILAILFRQNARFDEVKQANLCNRSLQESRGFWHATGQAHQTKHSVGTECAIQECMQK